MTCRHPLLLCSAAIRRPFASWTNSVFLLSRPLDRAPSLFPVLPISLQATTDWDVQDAIVAICGLSPSDLVLRRFAADGNDTVSVYPSHMLVYDSARRLRGDSN